MNITIIIIVIAIIMSPWSWRRSPRRLGVNTNLDQVVPGAVPATKQMIDKIFFTKKILVIQKTPASHPGLSCVPNPTSTTSTTINVVSREKLPLHRACRPWRQPRSWKFVIFKVCTFLLEPSLAETATWQVVQGSGKLSWGGQLLKGSAHLRGGRWFIWYCVGFLMY